VCSVVIARSSRPALLCSVVSVRYVSVVCARYILGSDVLMLLIIDWLNFLCWCNAGAEEADHRHRYLKENNVAKSMTVSNGFL
jgi:hypothetical protein